MTEKSRLAALVLLAERANRYGSLESQYPNDAKRAIKQTNLKGKLQGLSKAETSATDSRNFTYGL